MRSKNGAAEALAARMAGRKGDTGQRGGGKAPGTRWVICSMRMTGDIAPLLALLMAPGGTVLGIWESSCARAPVEQDL